MSKIAPYINLFKHIIDAKWYTPNLYDDMNNDNVLSENEIKTPGIEKSSLFDSIGYIDENDKKIYFYEHINDDPEQPAVIFEPGNYYIKYIDEDGLDISFNKIIEFKVE